MNSKGNLSLSTVAHSMTDYGSDRDHYKFLDSHVRVLTSLLGGIPKLFMNVLLPQVDFPALS